MLRREALGRIFGGVAVGGSVVDWLGRVLFGRPEASQVTVGEPVMVTGKTGSSDIEIDWVPVGKPIAIFWDRGDFERACQLPRYEGFWLQWHGPNGAHEVFDRTRTPAYRVHPSCAVPLELDIMGPNPL